MGCTSAEARKKLCIHERAITPSGKCVAEDCMAWKPIIQVVVSDEQPDLSKPFPNIDRKILPTDQGVCFFVLKNERT
jgi:hypothetical protein